MNKHFLIPFFSCFSFFSIFRFNKQISINIIFFLPEKKKPNRPISLLKIKIRLLNLNCVTGFFRLPLYPFTPKKFPRLLFSCITTKKKKNWCIRFRLEWHEGTVKHKIEEWTKKKKLFLSDLKSESCFSLKKKKKRFIYLEQHLRKKKFSS